MPCKFLLENVIQFCALILVSLIVFQSWIKGNQSILTANVQRIVNLPVHLAHLSCWMEQTLHSVLQNGGCTQCDTQTFDGFHHGIDDMRTIQAALDIRLLHIPYKLTLFQRCWAKCS